MERLGKNHGGYHGETIDIRAVLRDVETAAQQHGWTIGDVWASKANSNCSRCIACRHQLSTLNHQLEFTSAPASTATNPPGRSPR